ncbi:MAG TPA: diaminopimelate epimerase [Candidatus Acidoferrales bacterium]|nr:diaminopimelate epimerase [Candidatus Acidoferrales bacterium]
MIEINFTKMNGAGNDFVVIDNYHHTLNVDLPALAQAVCARGFGIGADGILLLQKGDRADFEMYYLNSDGSEGGMCGNGGRCIARFAVLNGICKPRTNFIAHGCDYSAEVIDADKVKLHFPVPEEITPSKKIPVDGKLFDAVYVHPNTDHTVLIEGFGRIDAADLTTLARKIRYNFDIFPRGTNVDLIEKKDGSKIRMRTYERGVENETLACGTGAVASAIAASVRYDMQSPIEIITTSKEILTVHFERNKEKFSNIVLEGSARVVFQGKILYDEKNNKIMDLMDGAGHYKM